MPFVNTMRASTSVSFKKKSGGPRAPGAPTIGSATAVTSTTATVSFTAPGNNGGSVITSYTATSSPGGITGTLSQAGSGTITVSGLTTGTAYTFTVTATNGAGTGIPSGASNSITPVLVIGEAYGGGYFVGKFSTNANGVATHNLVIAPRSSAASKEYKVPGAGTHYGGVSVFNGNSENGNTYELTQAGDDTAYPAAWYCNDLSVGGYSDWYLPSLKELEICYYNLKPTNENNYDNGFDLAAEQYRTSNPYAVPARSDFYTYGSYQGSPASNPAQTSVALFQSGGSEAFTSPSSFHWTSTKYLSDSNAVYFNFNLGMSITFKGFANSVRAMRRVAV